VDLNFYFPDADAVQETSFGGAFIPPADVAAKCANAPQQNLATTGLHYPERDCVEFQGQHWTEDKFETSQNSAGQPALRFTTLDGGPHSWQIGVPAEVTDWVLDPTTPSGEGGAIDDEVTISFPQPEAFFPRSGLYPTHYSIKQAAEEDEVQGGTTIEVSFKGFRKVNRSSTK
jgi:hypothetical protein